jgi:hypothetical protein
LAKLPYAQNTFVYQSNKVETETSLSPLHGKVRITCDTRKQNKKNNLLETKRGEPHTFFILPDIFIYLYLLAL